ncbi:MAG: MoaD/ThiS family protein [Anaerolineae bacterium]|nr:MoaD/ThiS family protein [Anaerolineae bacterium]
MRARTGSLAPQNMSTIHVEVWLYGPIAKYAGDQSQGSHARLLLELPAGTTVGALVEQLGIPPEEKGITFVNGKLAALPGLDADRGVVLHEGDRVGISHRRSMWPFQYRFGANLTDEVQETFRQRDDRGVHHAYTADKKQAPSDQEEGANGKGEDAGDT